MQTHYNYIIAGTGCAGLSLAMHLLNAGVPDSKSILLVDEAVKDRNDRTWCFWEKEEGLFQPIVFRQWDKLWFHGEGIGSEFAIAPYRYKMIRGIDFYTHCTERLQQHPNVTFLKGKVDGIVSEKGTGVSVDGQTFTADYVFNSILFKKPALSKKQHWLLQHFKGWHIKTQRPAFSTGSATLMDFRIPQRHGTAFCYVLPFSRTEALVEYTLFTASLLQDEEYDEGLQDYLQNVLRIDGFEVLDTEFGVIPMTNHRFPARKNNIINIGTAGGQTKGSSGYTFHFIQEHSRAIAKSLAKKEEPFVASANFRFPFYDGVLLEVLQRGELKGKEIFSTLFRKNKPADVLAFLNNESWLFQELKIISSLPTLPFLKAAVEQVV